VNEDQAGGSPPDTGGVAAASIKCREATLGRRRGGPSGTDVSIMAAWIISSTASRFFKSTLFSHSKISIPQLPRRRVALCRRYRSGPIAVL
jgi:hypothetical protein